MRSTVRAAFVGSDASLEGRLQHRHLDGYPRSIAGNRLGLAEAGITGPVDATWLE